jgi:hypothetical protein
MGYWQFNTDFGPCNRYREQLCSCSSHESPFGLHYRDQGPKTHSKHFVCVDVCSETLTDRFKLRIVNLIQANIPAIEHRMPSSPWCTSITICPKENQVVVGFDNSIVRFFKTTNSEEPREDRLHNRFHKDCKSCPAIDTLSFSRDGLVLLASTRMRGTIQVYSWRFPFVDFQEVAACRYYIPLHELEDNGTSSAIFRSGMGNEESLICITTWTQSGTPLLIQPHDGHRTEIRTEPSTHQGKLGSRIQGAAFSPTGRELVMVNDKGHVYIISNLNSNPLEVKRIATSKELTTKSDWFAMEFMSLPDEEAIVLAWADSAKGMGYVKKIPVKYSVRSPISLPALEIAELIQCDAGCLRFLDGPADTGGLAISPTI